MGMTIDKATNNLSEILTEDTENENSVCYVTENDAEALQVAIDTMRKYQKIQEIVEVWHQDIYAKDFECMAGIAEVVEDGKTDRVERSQEVFYIYVR